MAKINYYTDTSKDGLAIKLIEEEIAKLQRYLDDNFGYHKMGKESVGLAPGNIAYTPYDDYLLMRFRIEYGFDLMYTKHAKRDRIPHFYFVVYYDFIDLYLHPEDIHCSGEEKYNTVSLRPLADRREKDRLHYMGLLGDNNYPCTDYIYQEFNNIQERIKDKIFNELGQTIIFVPIGGYSSTRYHNNFDANGKPEQYKEYFCNYILHDTNSKKYIESTKAYVKKFYGLTITDEDLKNTKPMEDLYGTERFGKSLEEYRRKQAIKEREEQIKKAEVHKKETEALLNKKKSIAGKSVKPKKIKNKEKKEKVYRGESKVASFFKDSFAEFTLIDAIQVVLPVICMLAYVIIILAGGFKRIEIPYEFTGTLFGYDFELSNLALNWFESTHHEFFSAITLGFFQIILIVLGFLLDLVVHLIFFILALLWLLIIYVLINCLYFVIPVAIPVWLIINFFRVEKERKIFSAFGFVISAVCCIVYFVALMPYLK